MSFADVEERPAKKRRFFADDSGGPPASTQETSADTHEENDEDDGIKTWTPSTTSQPEPPNEFDGSLLESIIGEKLEANTIETLRKLSENNVERGKGCCH